MNAIVRCAFVPLLVGLIGSCAPKDEEVVPEVQTVNPPDSTQNVSRSAVIKVAFSEPMDMESCESRFGLYVGELTEIPASMAASVPGRFSWNDDQTVMTFEPDSKLEGSTTYSICLRQGMQTRHHDGRMMLSHMLDHGSPTGSGIISRFTTR